ncbi:MAG: P63C domain-containing protein [Burkholderiaceae bacterium]
MDEDKTTPSGRAKGGLATAAKMSAEDKALRAKKGAAARWGIPSDIPRAVAEGVLVIGDLRISCAVLDDANSTRVLTQEGFLTAIGRAGKAKGGEGATVDGLPAFMRANNLKPFINNDLVASTTPIEFVPLRGPGYQGRAFGYKASLLPGVCWVYQDAAVAGALLPSQKHIGKACSDFLKALTNYAIEDLVDIATGFEDMRKRRAIDKIIEKYVEKEAQPYARLFPLSFYQHIYRLNGWPFDPENSKRPGVVGTWTNDIYDRLAPGIRSALHERVRRNAKGRPTQKLTQYLTPENGKPHLERLLEGVLLLMRQSAKWDQFRLLLDQWYPKFNDTMQLPFDGEGERTYHLPVQPVLIGEKKAED